MGVRKAALLRNGEEDQEEEVVEEEELVAGERQENLGLTERRREGQDSVKINFGVVTWWFYGRRAKKRGDSMTPCHIHGNLSNRKLC